MILSLTLLQNAAVYQTFTCIDNTHNIHPDIFGPNPKTTQGHNMSQPSHLYIKCLPSRLAIISNKTMHQIELLCCKRASLVTKVDLETQNDLCHTITKVVISINEVTLVALNLRE